MSTPGLIPDGTGWVDAYGRPWISSGNELLLWELPVITLLGVDPQFVQQYSPYPEAGATAVDAQATDITGLIVIDSSAVDTDIPASYIVTYDVTDAEGYTDHVEREVIVTDSDRPDVRHITHGFLAAGAPEGFYTYQTPPEQLKVPCAVIGTMSWTPDRMASLAHVEWDIEIRVFVTRSAPQYYGIYNVETAGLKVARLLIEQGYRVVGFTDEGMVEVGGTAYLSGTLQVIYKQTEA